MLINFFGIKILTDPVLFSRIGIRLPGLTLGPKRLTASALTVRDLPKIEIVPLSHAHFDHFDMRTLHRLDRSATVITAGRTLDLLRWKGCFTAAYPNTEWQEVLCTTTPPYPQPPRRGPQPETVGDANDFSAEAPTGSISTAIGSFDTVTGVTSESGPIGNTGPSVANAYTLQLNTNFFTSTVCFGTPNPQCRGWEQFVFENDGSSGRVSIQYWLIKYNTNCPAGQGWNQFSFNGDPDIYCWKNDSMGATPVPAQPITNNTSLSQLTLAGTVGRGGDSATFSNLSTGTWRKALRASRTTSP